MMAGSIRKQSKARRRVNFETKQRKPNRLFRSMMLAFLLISELVLHNTVLVLLVVVLDQWVHSSCHAMYITIEKGEANTVQRADLRFSLNERGTLQIGPIFRMVRYCIVLLYYVDDNISLFEERALVGLDRRSHLGTFAWISLSF